jgi:hypothetical protein
VTATVHAVGRVEARPSAELAVGPRTSRHLLNDGLNDDEGVIGGEDELVA